jgi:hypothetical protein
VKEVGERPGGLTTRETRFTWREDHGVQQGKVKAEPAKIVFVGRGDLSWRVIPNETRR